MSPQVRDDTPGIFLGCIFTIYFFWILGGQGVPQGWGPEASDYLGFMFFLAGAFVAGWTELKGTPFRRLRYVTYGALAGAVFCPLFIRRFDANEGIVFIWIALIVGGAILTAIVARVGKFLGDVDPPRDS